MIEIRLLGPLEVVKEGCSLALPHGKPSALLARLALEIDRVVATEALADSLWEGIPPASAHKLVQVYVSQLRNELGPVIETRPPGYRLSSDETESDLGRFERLIETARDMSEAARRVELTRQALSLWRGPALAEFRHEPFALPAARRLAELRLSTLEQRIEAELELGEHARLIGELEALVASEPLRERARWQLMLALYRSGRQAEALDYYRQGRQILTEELGIEPSRPLQDLQQAVLRRDPRLDHHSGPTPQLPGSVVCVGSQLHELVSPLCKDGRELLLVEIAASPAELPQRSATLERCRAEMVEAGIEVRTVCFTSSVPGGDLGRLAREQDSSLLLWAGLPQAAALRALMAEIPCDLALAPRPELQIGKTGPVLVPFGGGREEWAAIELAAWLARSLSLPLRLLGTEACADRRDASRMLASASLALQRFAGVSAEPAISAAGADGILAQEGALIVAAFTRAELDQTRRTLIERTQVPLLFVHHGLRPGGLASERTLTRFNWSLADE